MKVALVHYWLHEMRGGEKVLEALCEMFPECDIYTHLYDPAAMSAVINRHNVHTSFIDRLPFAKNFYAYYLPLMPFALEELDLQQYDLVISSESGPAKGIITNPHAVHICYCHSPLRHLWDQYHIYANASGAIKRLLMAKLLHRLRLWDVTSAARVDAFAANSRHVAARIHKYYRRNAVVIHPPVETSVFTCTPLNQRSDRYLVAGALVPYKRVEVAVEAFNKLQRPLTVIGGGSELPRLKKLASDNIRFLGHVDDSQLRYEMAHARALIFPGEEDFGIIPVEAMACGTPVIAFGRGGALDTVVDNRTGILFKEQSAMSLMDAILKFETMIDHFDPLALRQHAQSFSHAAFQAAINQLIADTKQNNQAASQQ